ncbi:LysR family transcriptional regulator [Saccharopolyspora sp. HNM0983]|uniref:LysR family transcriptional regulator n=1 Tax=Saccharopolyspora montiporae TaxID=2781240 RepID=A0A929G0J9_9PSEU|nr:LysR family transcriptional regulator [Saccharopolyspora sp. HNM0983]MBE9373688.1 LysR family transcriptional regulator [Saccharopolyspora sp. HNM0983]
MIDGKLKVLQMVARYGTVTAAAQALHYTPSAVSYQLRQLAEELGVELVRPAGRGIQLTSAAGIVLQHADALHAQAELLYSELAADEAEPAGSVTVCGFSTAATHLLPPAASALRERFPQVRVRLIEAEPARCFDLLLSGEADLALVISTADTPPTSDERFEQRRLLDDPLDLVVPADHPLTRQKRVTLADATDESWIVGSPGGTYHHLVLSACTAAGFTPGIEHYADEWNTGTALVARGFGIILVPRLAQLDQDRTVARIPLHGEPAPARRIVAATRRGRSTHPVVAAAMSTIGSIAEELLPRPTG